jgi:hypothetical protein
MFAFAASDLRAGGRLVPKALLDNRKRLVSKHNRKVDHIRAAGKS